MNIPNGTDAYPKGKNRKGNEIVTKTLRPDKLGTALYFTHRLKKNYDEKAFKDAYHYENLLVILTETNMPYALREDLFAEFFNGKISVENLVNSLVEY